MHSCQLPPTQGAPAGGQREGGSPLPVRPALQLQLPCSLLLPMPCVGFLLPPELGSQGCFPRTRQS